METHVRDAERTVEIWLTRQEQNDAALRERLKPLYQTYQAQKYLVAVFLSGEQDLVDYTSALLCYNRRRIAELETARQKAVNA